MYLSDFEYLYLFQKYSSSNFKIVRNRAKFCMFLAPKIFWGKPPKFLDHYYKTERTSAHSAKFRNEWPTELEDVMAKKINASKIQVRSENYRFRAD